MSGMRCGRGATHAVGARRAWLALAWLLLVGTAFAADAPGAPQPLDARTIETLLEEESEPASRQQALREVVARAQAGEAWSAYLLGALYRSGMDHPARLFERDPDTARHWLMRCVGSAGCPLLALASLAELELAERRAKPAMQWAQAWVVLDRELAERLRAGDEPSSTSLRALMRTSYHAYLIERCYALMQGSQAERDAQGLAWFNELRATHGKALDRMFFAALDERTDLLTPIDQGLEPSAENQRRRTIDGNAPAPRQPALGVYLYRGDPAGGPAEAVQTIEALPNPMKTFGMRTLARSMRTKPYQATAGERRYAVLPLAFGQSDYYLFDPD